MILAMYETAGELAMRLGQPLFDILYHALALHTPDATLVTADKRYFRNAGHAGRIALLADFVP